MRNWKYAEGCVTIRSNIWKILKSPWVLRMLNLLKCYLTGVSVTLIVTECGKISIGRLRPHFLDVCKPNFTLINCTDVGGYPVYVDKFECFGDPNLINDAR